MCLTNFSMLCFSFHSTKYFLISLVILTYELLRIHLFSKYLVISPCISLLWMLVQFHCAQKTYSAWYLLLYLLKLVLSFRIWFIVVTIQCEIISYAHCAIFRCKVVQMSIRSHGLTVISIRYFLLLFFEFADFFQFLFHIHGVFNYLFIFWLLNYLYCFQITYIVHLQSLKYIQIYW